MYPTCISGVSQVYPRCIPGVSQEYPRCTVSLVYPGVSQVFLIPVYSRCILGVSTCTKFTHAYREITKCARTTGHVMRDMYEYITHTLATAISFKIDCSMKFSKLVFEIFHEFLGKLVKYFENPMLQSLL